MAIVFALQAKSLSEGADSVGGQLCGDKDSLFHGVTSSGRVCRMAPEDDAWSVLWTLSSDSAPHNELNIKVNLIAACFNAEIVLAVTV